MQVDVRHIFTSKGHNYVGRFGQDPLEHPIQHLDEVECVAGRGLVGDRYFDHEDNYKGQVTFFSWEVFERMRDELRVHDAEPWAMRRNILLQGIDLNSLVGNTFSIQGISLLGTEECRPCSWMDQALTEGAHDWLKGQGGLRCRILSSGVLRVGPCELVISQAG